MPSIPLDVDDEVLYTIRKVYLSRDTSVTIQTRLDFWGSVFFNGSPIANIGAIPIATQAQAEAGTDNSTVMSPLRTAQAITVQAKPAVLAGNGGGTTNYLRADGLWMPPPGGAGLSDGDKGDISVTGGVWTIDNAVVTNAKMANMNAQTFKGNATGAPAAPSDFTVASAKSLLNITNIDNTSDVNKPVSTAQAAADALKADKTYVDSQDAGKQPLDSDLTAIAALTPTTGNFLASVASAWSSITPAAAKTSLVLVKGDVGLGNVDNTSDVNKPVSTAQAAADALKVSKTGDAMSGALTLITPAAANDAVRKDYADNKRYTAVRAISATSYTLAQTDEPQLLQFTAATAVTFTIPPNSSVPWPVAAYQDFYQDGVGQVTVAPGAGVTIIRTPSLLLRAQGSAASIIKVATDTWLLTGDLA